MNCPKHAAATDQGRVRANNEDAFFQSPESGIFLVSDGMGGENAGEVASRIVAEILPSVLARELAGMDDPSSQSFIDKVDACISNISSAVHAASVQKDHLKGMGATLTMAVIRGGRALVANVGDSRTYLYRKGVMTQISKDHSVVQLLLDAGEISKAEADSHPLRGQLMRCIGMQGVARPDCYLVDLQEGDKMLLCSDGLTDMLTDESIKNVLKLPRTPKAICAKLIEKANEIGGVDNITALVLHFAKERKKPGSAAVKAAKLAPKGLAARKRRAK